MDKSIESAITTPKMLLGATDYDEDDIELQIKSSIMIKKPLQTTTGSSALPQATAPEVKQLAVDGAQHDHNQNHALDDELELFQRVPVQSTVTEDFCSVGSGEPTAGEDTVEEFNTEEEDVEETFLDFAPELEAFPGSEIIVLNDADLNSSIASDVPSEDPLAIDDFTQPSSSRDNPLDTSSINDEASTSTDLLWLDVQELKEPTCTTVADSVSVQQSEVASYAEGPLKRTPINAALGSQVRPSLIGSEEQAEELRSDGSDSGLGSETSTLHNTLSSVVDSSQLINSAAPTLDRLDAPILSTTQTQTPTSTPTDANNSCAASSTIPTLTSSTSSTCTTSSIRSSPTPASLTTLAVLSRPPISLQKPLRSNLKRRLAVVDDMLDTDSSALASVDASIACLDTQTPKKPKRSINFDTVQVYYFPRQQGFSCVPSAGGCTLGMAARHVATKTLTLAEHAAELRRAHRLQLQEINPRGSSSDDSEESEEDYLSEGSGSDLDAESNGFLQPVSPKQRRALLKAAGVRKIDPSEKAECRDIRNSREVCGCSCRDFCDPETCACSQAGIKCQVDHAMFPCGCSRDACLNTVGRVEFNPARVRTHYIHTVMRLEMEQRQQQHPTTMGYGMSMCASVSASISSAGAQANGTSALAAQSSYYGLQTQSNYSSGYASPAYSGDPTANYYQAQVSQTQQQTYGAACTTLHAEQLQHQQTTVQTTGTPAPAYQLDSLDSSLFSSAATATPSYGELIPNYGAVNSTVCAAGTAAVAASSASIYHNMSYSSLNGGMQTQVSAYTSYQQHHLQATAHYLATPRVESDACASVPPTTYSSCAVPSVPPYGTATTTVASSQYHNACAVALETTAPSCGDIVGGGGVGLGGGGGGTSFIDLNTPIASSSRLSQINDLLQHNRNTTAALVAVSQSGSCGVLGNRSAALANAAVATAATASIDTPPIEDAQKSCLAFEELPSPLHPAPIVAVLQQNVTAKLPATEPPPVNNDTTTTTTTTVATATTTKAIESIAAAGLNSFTTNTAASVTTATTSSTITTNSDTTTTTTATASAGTDSALDALVSN